MKRMTTSNSILLSLLAIVAWGRAALAETDYGAVVTRLEAAVNAERSAWGIGGVSVALTDGTRVVHLGAYGEATTNSVFRAGSISKLFNAVAVMQLVEAGRLDLDAPVTNYPGAVVPLQPSAEGGPVTLRQLLSHRSGLPREAPKGGYLDGSEPGLDATCESLRDCVLATAPKAKTRYSNVAPSIAGRVVAAVRGESFEALQRRYVLQPLGMKHSEWRRASVPEGALIVSRMRVADPKAVGVYERRESPVFDLGTIPAGNLFTTAPDLAQFLVALARAMRGESGVLKPETFFEMWKPLWESNGPFGVGFALGKFRGHRTVGHSGAVYGHSTSVVFLPEMQLGVVVLANEDIVNARVGRLSNLALSWMLEAKTGERGTPERERGPALRGEELATFAGQFESQSYWASLRVDSGKLVGDYSGQPCELTPTAGGTFLLNSRIHDDVPVTFERDGTGRVTGFTAAPQVFRRVAEGLEPVPRRWRAFCGAYGPDFIPLIVLEKWGRLYVTTENMVDYRLTPVNRHVFGLPPGMYVDEHLVFLGDDADGPRAIEFASMPMLRIPGARAR